MARAPLSREKILDAAFVLAADGGLDGLSMRRLARSLGVEAMSLYNHVASKGDLLDAMAGRVLGEIAVPDSALPWPERVRDVALSMYRALRRHPAVALAVVTDQANPVTEAALRPFDALAGALMDAGFADAGVRRAFLAVSGLVYGSLVLSTAGFQVEDFFAEQSDEQVEFFTRGVAPDRLPALRHLLSTFGGGDSERDFEHGLDVLIAGLVTAAK
ncbi:TetR/AcrR family transcriptional regulator C-terminal domain-containing protein [Actinomadura roseirufa]|uniref:TetR/AcrR family transcriptional regulator C-terminal domain-containing protein n=1 Tax=Actinomadura roseirufa TaxID=2094049 RepID=UPI0010415E79|nr:TetR/AcrR family transcriptional regulator C-terminal domain-containing protein [Actinomadura roseirufa]